MREGLPRESFSVPDGAERRPPDEGRVEGTGDDVRQYLNRIGQVALLTAGEEVELSKRIEAGVFAERLVSFTEAPDRQEARRQLYAESLAASRKYYKEVEKAKGNNVIGLFSVKSSKHPTREERRLDKLARKRANRTYKFFDEYKITPSKKQSLKAVAEDGKEAMDTMVEANLRWVVTIAKRYKPGGLTFFDYIQEGNLGLIHAVKKFDYAKGNKFSTYSTTWIRQAIGRAIHERSTIITLPAHVGEQVTKMIRITDELKKQEHDTPTAAMIAAAMGVSVQRVEELQSYAQSMVSLDMPVGEDSMDPLGDFVEDTEAINGEDAAVIYIRNETIKEALKALPDEEAQIVVWRFGLDGQEPRTFEMIGKYLGGQSGDLISDRMERAMNRLSRPEHIAALRAYHEV